MQFSGLFLAGWLAVPAVSFMINHFDLFGTRQVWLYWRGEVSGRCRSIFRSSIAAFDIRCTSAGHWPFGRRP